MMVLKGIGWVTRLMATTALAGVCVAGPVLAASEGEGVRVAQAEAEAKRFDIPAQGLAAALAAFARQSGFQVTMDNAIIGGQSSTAVSGTLSPQAALSKLLTGTGIVWQMIDGKSVALSKVAAQGALTLDPVSVEGAAGRATAAAEQTALGPVRGYVATRAISAAKTDTPLIETPQSISVVPRDQITQQNAQTLNQALRYSAGVQPETRGAVATRYDMLTVRGLTADKYWNGMKLQDLYYAAAQVDPYLLERIEVLKGPASVLYGQAPAGGLVNQSSKRPLDTPYHEIGQEIGSNNHFRTNADFSGPMDAEGKFLYRLTATGLKEDGQINSTENERHAIAPAFTWKPDGDTHLTLLGFYQNDPKGNSYGSVPPKGSAQYNPLGRLPSDFYDGDPNFERFEREQAAGGYEFDRRLSDMFSLRLNGRAIHTTMAYDSVYASSLQADNRTLTRGTASSRENMTVYTADNQLESRVQTGPLQHTILTGFDVRHYDGDYHVGFGSAPSLDIFAPVYGMNIAAPSLSRTDVSGNQFGLYLQDQIRWKRFILTLGGRHDRATATTETSSSTTKQDDSAWTNKAGLTYVFDNGIAPYVSYAESFTPVAKTDFYNNPFKPEEGTQHEVGVKYQPPGSNSLYTLSAFNIVRTNVTTSDPAHTNYSIQAGEVRSRGLELEARTALNEQWDLIGAYTYIDAKVTKDNGGLEGNQLGVVPRHQASTWAMYHFPAGTELTGLSLGGGVRYVGSTVDPNNTVKVEAYTLADAALSYDLGALSAEMEGTELTLNVKNLFDKRYVASCYYTGWCAYGYDRTVTAGINVRW